MMVVKIQQYFTNALKITEEEAHKLHQDYYRSYGLALEGLVRHHKIGTASPLRFPAATQTSPFTSNVESGAKGRPAGV